jgi:formate dehydrogenase major subunit
MRSCALALKRWARTVRAFSSLELCVVQDLFVNETAREFASAFLPAACSFEKDGTFMNSERRVQRVRRAVPPPGEALPDWQILCQVARAMDHEEGFDFESPEEIWEEIRQLWPAGAGIDYRRIERHGLQWPCPTAEHPGTELLHAQTFAGASRAECYDRRATGLRLDRDHAEILSSWKEHGAGTSVQITNFVVAAPAEKFDFWSGNTTESRLFGPSPYDFQRRTDQAGASLDDMDQGCGAFERHLRHLRQLRHQRASRCTPRCIQ